MDKFMQPVVTAPLLAFPGDAQADYPHSATVFSAESYMWAFVAVSSPFHLHLSHSRRERGEFCFSTVAGVCRRVFS